MGSERQKKRNALICFIFFKSFEVLGIVLGIGIILGIGGTPVSQIHRFRGCSCFAGTPVSRGCSCFVGAAVGGGRETSGGSEEDKWTRVF